MGKAPGKSTAPSLQPVAALLHCVLIRISAPSSELIMDLISAFFSAVVLVPFFSFSVLGGELILWLSANMQECLQFTYYCLPPGLIL